MFMHQKILVILGSVLTLAMTAYVSMTPATVEAREDKVIQEMVSETETVNLITETVGLETETADLETKAAETETKKAAPDKKAETKKETKAEQTVASKPSSSNKDNESVKPTTGTASGSTSSGASTTTKPAGTTTTSKPSGNNNTTSTSKPSGSNNNATASKPSGSTSSNTSSKPSAHTHTWVASTTTVHHDATGHYEEVVIYDAWDERVYDYETHWICNTCGADITSDPGGHLFDVEHDGYHAEYESVLVDTIHHPAETMQHWIEDSAAWDETVTTYTCSCGATR